MKLFALTVPLTLSLTARAASHFSFTAHHELFGNTISHLTAQLKIADGIQTCLVDTGARYTIAKVDVLKNEEKVGETLGGGLSNLNVVTDLVRTNLQIGDWKIDSAIIGRTDRIPYPCLIGNDFFMNKAFAIDLKKNTFTEVEPLSAESELLDVYEHDRGGHFGFDVFVADQKTKSIFDTGASQTVIHSQMVADHPENFVFLKALDATDGNSATIKAGLYRLKQFSFANVVLKNIDVIVVDLTNLKPKLPQVDVVIGMDIIQNHNWVLDTKSRLWNFGHTANN